MYETNNWGEPSEPHSNHLYKTITIPMYVCMYVCDYGAIHCPRALHTHTHYYTISAGAHVIHHVRVSMCTHKLVKDCQCSPRVM